METGPILIAGLLCVFVGAAIGIVVFGFLSIALPLWLYARSRPTTDRWVAWRAQMVEAASKEQANLAEVPFAQLQFGHLSGPWRYKYGVTARAGYLQGPGKGDRVAYYDYAYRSRYIWVFATFDHVVVMEGLRQDLAIEVNGQPLGRFTGTRAMLDTDGQPVGHLRRSTHGVSFDPLWHYERNTDQPGDRIKEGAVVFDAGPRVEMVDLRYGSDHFRLPIITHMPEDLSEAQLAWTIAMVCWATVERQED